MTLPPSTSLPPTHPPAPPRTAMMLATGACLAALLLYARPLCTPVLSQDDFQILAQSWTWRRTLDGLWLPNNEHVMPLGRLLTFAVVQVAGRPTALPFVCVAVGVCGLLPGMVLVYHFVRRELGHPLYGLVAMSLFGVTAVYQQAVYWFAASFSVFALDALLLALLAAQRYRHTGRVRWLLACAAGAALAPCWFASGVLAGPLCCLYLLPAEPPGEELRRRTWAGRLGTLLLRLTPVLGTAAFLAVSLPRSAETIQHLEHYRDKTALQSFQPLVGALYTGRSLVDNLLLGVVGVTSVAVWPPLVAVLLVVLGPVAAGWALRSPRRRLALLGAGLILGSYLLIYSARASWPYAGEGGSMYTPTMCRYHLQPQLGLALFVCGGLPEWNGRWFTLDPTGRLTRRQAAALAWLIGLCLLIQSPRGLFCYYDPNPQQELTLSRIERVDAYCREHRIRAEDARRELGVLPMPESATKVDGWEFLRGSDDPVDWSPEEVQDMLEAAR